MSIVPAGLETVLTHHPRARPPLTALAATPTLPAWKPFVYHPILDGGAGLYNQWWFLDQLKIMILKDPNMRVGVIASVIASIIVIIFIQPLLNVVWVGIIALTGAISTSTLNMIYHEAALENSEEAPLMILMFMLLFFAGSFLFRSRPLAKQDIILLTFLFMCGVAGCAGIYGKAEIAGSYRQRIAILAPHITDQDRKTLEAEWKSITTRLAYQRLVGKMEALAATNSVVLPEPRP